MHVFVSILIAGSAQLRVIGGFRLAQVMQFQVGDLVCRGICGNRICGRTSGDMCFFAMLISDMHHASRPHAENN